MTWMKTIAFLISLHFAAAMAASADNAAETSEQAQSVKSNLEISIRKNAGDDITAWTGQVFALPTGKPVQSVSPQQRLLFLPEGNYLLMLNFDETAGEMKGQHPFTFTIVSDARTLFLLTIGRSQEPEFEQGVVRTGADFVEGESRKGRDYINFGVPTNNPLDCLAKCRSDRNCDVYSYTKPSEASHGRCWLIHGAAAVTDHAPHAASGIIHRETSPYQLQITSEKFTPKK